jgi:uroporphyrin-III C-methyltransferase
MYTGKVIIVGAGPGDPELITHKAVKYLQQADVVLTDRLVSRELLDEYVNLEAEIIYVGKEAGSARSTPQKKINDLLVEHYYQDKLVVRLKGGDVSIFSNILDELETLQEHKIPYEIIPGITAASGAAAYSGIPLTARGYADSVRYLTCYKSEYKPENYWRELAKTDDTLVFYMSGENIDTLVFNLIRHNISADKAIAVITQATTPCQHVSIYQFDDINTLTNTAFVSPTLIIIGKVVNLYQRFSWKDNSINSDSYFKSVSYIRNRLSVL